MAKRITMPEKKPKNSEPKRVSVSVRVTPEFKQLIKKKSMEFFGGDGSDNDVSRLIRTILKDHLDEYGPR